MKTLLNTLTISLSVYGLVAIVSQLLAGFLVVAAISTIIFYK